MHMKVYDTNNESIDVLDVPWAYYLHFSWHFNHQTFIPQYIPFFPTHLTQYWNALQEE